MISSSQVPRRDVSPDSPSTLTFPTLYEEPSSPRLRECFERYVEPTLRHAAPKTLKDYQTLLNHWERLTSDPTIAALTPELLQQFQSALATEEIEGGRRSPGTVNKMFRVLKPIVRAVEPPDSHNRAGRGLIGYQRFPRDLKQIPKLPRIASHDELNRLYVACSHATWPRNEPNPPVDYWRGFLVLAANYGPRTYDLLSLTWDAVDWEWGGFSFTAQKTHKLQRLPFNAVTRGHLERLATRDRARVFPKFDYGNQSVRRAWNAICESAGITRRLLMEDLRKTCDTAYETHFPGVGQWILGHSLRGVNARNYFDPTEAVRHAVENLPQPSEFLSILEHPARRQLALF